MDTLTPLHDELDASLNRILDRIDTQVLEAHLKKAHEDDLPHRYMRPDPEDDE